MEQQPTLDLASARAEFLAALSPYPNRLGNRRRCFEETLRYTVELQSAGRETPLGNLIDENLVSVGPSHLITRILRYTTYALLDHYRGFPENFDTIDEWLRGYAYIYRDPEVGGFFESNVENRNLVSNVSDRAKGLKLALLLGRFAGRLALNAADPCTIVDVGCSGLLGDMHLIGSPHDYLFGRPDFVLSPDAATLSESGLRYSLAPAYMKAVHGLLNEVISFGQVVGIDLITPDDNRAMIRACSFDPDEFEDNDRVKLFNDLADVRNRPSNLHFAKPDDFATFRRQLFEEQFPEYRPQVVNISSMLYEETSENRGAILRNAANLATEYVIVQDYLAVDKKTGKINIRDNWQNNPWSYRTAIIDVREDEQRAHEILVWKSSRVMAMAPGLGRIPASGASFGPRGVSFVTMLEEYVREHGLRDTRPEDVRTAPPRSKLSFTA